MRTRCRTPKLSSSEQTPTTTSTIVSAESAPIASSASAEKDQESILSSSNNKGVVVGRSTAKELSVEKTSELPPQHASREAFVSPPAKDDAMHANDPSEAEVERQEEPKNDVGVEQAVVEVASPATPSILIDEQAKESTVDPIVNGKEARRTPPKVLLPTEDQTSPKLSTPKFSVSYADMAKKVNPVSHQSSRNNIHASKMTAAPTTNGMDSKKTAAPPNKTAASESRVPVTTTMTTRFVPSLSAVVTASNGSNKSKPKATGVDSKKRSKKKKPAKMTDEEAAALDNEQRQLPTTSTNRSLTATVMTTTTMTMHPESTKAATAVPSPDTNRLVMLVSKQSIQRSVIGNQEKAMTICSSKGIPYEIVDGSDPANKEVRENLFQVSGLGPTTYPQFFVAKNGEMSFWGDWEQFEMCNETGTLEEKLGLRGSPKKAAGGGGPAQSAEAPVAAAGSTSTTGSAPSASSSSSTGQSSGKGGGGASAGDAAVASGRKADSAVAASRKTKTDITVYGATSFVAKHALDYFMQVSLAIPGEIKITLAGRDKAKINALQKSLTQKMSNLRTVNARSKGKCVFDTFVADSSDAAGLKKMAARTTVVANFAGPFTKYAENVVAGCAQTGADYVDITGEVTWAGKMRLKYSDVAQKSGSRIISLCGYDSIPSDMAVFAAVEGLRESNVSVEVEQATTWHHALGTANGGTVHTALDITVDLRHCFFQPVPFLADDPLVLTHPRTRVDPHMQDTKNRMAKAEWFNQLPRIDSILGLGISAPFFMAPVNAKVVQASAVALNYGKNFTYRERFLPTGFKFTRKLGLVSLVPVLIVQVGILLLFVILKLPIIGKALANLVAPPGSGMPDHACKAGFCEVYSEVTSTAPGAAGAANLVNRANCFMKFEGDPGNWTTAQCICESALALVLDKDKLPLRSQDGFGTPAELLGGVLLRRLQETSVRPVQVSVNVRSLVPRRETVVYDYA